MKKEAIIIDLEGTLSNCQHRIHFLNKKDYANWNNLFIQDPLNHSIADIIIDGFENKQSIIISTAKEEKYANDVLHWAAKWDLSKYISQFYFREPCQDNWSSVDVKRQQLNNIQKEFKVIAAYDDRYENVEMYHKSGISAFLFKENVITELKTFSSDTNPAMRLRNAAKLFEERNSEYGQSYLHFGNIMKSYFPNGVKLETEKDFSRFAALLISIAKVDRYCKNFSNGGHKDSLDDLAVYSQMLNHIDEVVK